eukprot:gene18289-biopygen21940
MTCRIWQDRTPIFPTPPNCWSLARSQLPDALRGAEEMAAPRSYHQQVCHVVNEHHGCGGLGNGDHCTLTQWTEYLLIPYPRVSSPPATPVESPHDLENRIFTTQRPAFP